MRRGTLVLIAAVLASAAPVLAARPPGQGSKITAAARPTPLTFGAAVTVSGKLTGNNNGGRRVQLSEDPYPYGDGYADVAAATTAANGDYSFRLVPATNRNYRVTVGGEQAFTGVRIRKRVSLGVSDATPRKGQRVAFAGFVAPKHDGRTVLIQRLSSTGAWSTVRRTTLRLTTGDRSRFRTTLTIRRSGSYRALVGADGDHLSGTSRTRVLRIG